MRFPLNIVCRNGDRMRTCFFQDCACINGDIIATCFPFRFCMYEWRYKTPGAKQPGRAIHLPLHSFMYLSYSYLDKLHDILHISNIHSSRRSLNVSVHTIQTIYTYIHVYIYLCIYICVCVCVWSAVLYMYVVFTRRAAAWK
jgi:hypothetical protein